ncbi:MAG: hypothetical protein GTN81_02835 [Proteobacteria bacterium]|nr:hypothetical protein [Pseudomonadota bacterium]
MGPPTLPQTPLRDMNVHKTEETPRHDGSLADRLGEPSSTTQILTALETIAANLC